MSNERCAEFQQQGTVARYVIGTASAAEAVALEDHYVECERCRNEVLLASAIRDGVSAIPAASGGSRRTRRIMRAGLLLTAAAVASVLLIRVSAGRRLERYGALAAPPAYGGVSVRAEVAAADSIFAAAMRAYRAADYGVAADLLENAIRAGMAPAPAEFFLGASLLQLDEAAAAAASFRRVIAVGPNIYYDEANYYLAKALLRLHRRAEALAALAAAAASSGAIAAPARALADSIR